MTVVYSGLVAVIEFTMARENRLLTLIRVVKLVYLLVCWLLVKSLGVHINRKLQTEIF